MVEILFNRLYNIMGNGDLFNEISQWCCIKKDLLSPQQLT